MPQNEGVDAEKKAFTRCTPQQRKDADQPGLSAQADDTNEEAACWLEMKAAV